MTPIVELKNICKSFTGVQALTDINLKLFSGEVHALVGENGAGKSTMIKLLMGVHQKTSGNIYIDSNAVEIKSTGDAKRNGFSAVYQDINFATHLTVAENFFIGELPTNKFGLVDYKKINNLTYDILKSIDVDINPMSIVRNLSVAEQEMIAIGKVFHQKAKVVIFDEPTALLTEKEIEKLFKIIEILKNKNVAVLYVSHKLEEILHICDKVTVLKDGIKVDTISTQGIDENTLISMMVGRDVEDMYNIKTYVNENIVLEVRNLCRYVNFSKQKLNCDKFHNSINYSTNLHSKKVFENINFSVKQGEIFGMFGLVGSGRTEIVRTIFGADMKTSGEIYINNELVDINNPKNGVENGIAFLPENRKEEGLCLKLSVSDNTNMVAIENVVKNGIISKEKSDSISTKYVNKLNTKTTSINELCRNLSGGNQQKVVISKWLAENSRIFIFDEPTVGIDIGAKAEIYKMFENLSKEGKTIIIISSYLPEVMGLADRLLVVYQGQQMGIFEKSEFDDKNILKLASGLKK